MLTMHNTGPLLVLCIVTSYARRNVSQIVTIVTSAKKCHTCKIIKYVVRQKPGDTVYLHGIYIHWERGAKYLTSSSCEMG